MAGSGVTGDLLAHNIDTAMWLNGPIAEVSAMTETFIKERKHNLTGKVEPVGIDDASAFLARFENGSLATFEATRYARGHKALYTLEINGEHASAFWDLHDLHRIQYFDHRDEGRVRGWRNIHVTDGDQPYMKHWWVPGLQIGYEHTFTHQFMEFVQAAAKGKSPSPTFRDGLATDRVTDAVLASAKSRQWEKVADMMTRNTHGDRRRCLLTACARRRALAGTAGGPRPRGASRSAAASIRGSHGVCRRSSTDRRLKGWDGDSKFWRVEGGAIVGQTTAENPLKENSFIIWRGGEPADFELKVEYRIDATNSGIQIRSVHLPAGTQQGRGAIAGNWVLKGYQCDIDAANRFTGQIYEERGRGFLAMRGQFTYIPDGGGPRVVGALQRSRRRAAEDHQGERLEPGARHRTRQHDHRDPERSRHQHARGRRHQGARVEGTARLPDSRRRADEGRVQEHLVEAVLTHVRRARSSS